MEQTDKPVLPGKASPLESALLEFIDNAPVGIYRTRSDGTIAIANSAFIRMLGYPDAETLYRTNASKLCADARDGAIYLRELMQHGVVSHFETRLSRHDGAHLWVELHARAIKNDHGHLRMYEGVAIDISQRKHAEQMMSALASSLEESFEQTILSISRMMEKRDPYTAIHQQKVARLARTLGSELGLSAEHVKGIHFGALIHDIGKFFVPLEFLCSPGTLGVNEMELIRRHTCSGYEVVKNIASQWPIPDMIRQHHERMDGSGYPFGIVGENILVESRIIAVADTFEAMSGHRPYRPSLGMARALHEIRSGSGIKYDPDVAQTCLRLIEERGYSVENEG
ncbi:MAG: HD-GYP domain-containing protein [Rhodoferax sp.]